MIYPLFISGLPRSGSTLLSAILNQNPLFSASISGPLCRMVETVIETASTKGFQVECPVGKRQEIIKAMFEAYYPQPQVCCDTSRLWSRHVPLIKDLYPETAVVILVRDIVSILNSFEILFQNNPYSQTLMIPENIRGIHARTDYLMHHESIVGAAYQATLEGIYSLPSKEMVLLIEYDDLVKHPNDTLDTLYDFIGLDRFKHDFDNVESSYDEYDADLNTKGLHITRKKVSWEPKQIILPPDVIQKWTGLEQWRRK